MISLSQQELQTIEEQFALAMTRAIERVQDNIAQASVAAVHWVSHDCSGSRISREAL